MRAEVPRVQAGRSGHGLHWVGMEPGSSVGGGGFDQVSAGLAVGTGDRAPVEVDGEVVSGEAGLFFVLPGAAGLDRSDEVDLVVSCGAVEQGDGDVAAVDQVLPGQQPTVAEPVVDAGRASVSLVGVVVAMSVIRLTRESHHDLPQGFCAGTALVGWQTFEEPAGVCPGLFETGDRMARLAGKADMPAVADDPLGVHQLVQELGGASGGFFQRGAYRFEDEFQAGEFPRCDKDLGGVGSLSSAFLDQTGTPRPVQGQGQQLVRAVVPGQPVPEVGQHAVVKPGIVQLHGQGVLEVDAAPDGLGCLPVREVEQELQHAHGRQLSR